MRIVCCAAILATLALTACDNTPDPRFEKSMKDRSAAQNGDAYASLETSAPQSSRYLRQKPALRHDYAVAQAATFRSAYGALLGQFDADDAVDHASPIVASCRRAFVAGSAFQSGARAANAGPVLLQLRACRDQAKTDGKRSALLARLASAGAVLVGVTVVSQGDTDGGLRIWRAGEDQMAKDEPGFQLGIQSFGG